MSDTTTSTITSTTISEIYGTQTSGDALDVVRGLLASVTSTYWTEATRDYAERVAEYGRYYRGEHPLNMTPTMKKMLRVSDNRLDTLRTNFCRLVIDQMRDRLQVTRMESDNEGASAWAAQMLDANRFDDLQNHVHMTALVEGDTYVMVSYDAEEDRVVLTHEPTFDGTEGVIFVYTHNTRTPVAAVKLWWEVLDGNTVRRFNIYTAREITRYRVESTIVEIDRQANPMNMIPIVHFRHNPTPRSVWGQSELKDVIPLQNVLNRLTASALMATELTAFQVYVAKGFEPPAELSAGMMITVSVEGAGNPQDTARLLEASNITALQQGENHQFLAHIQHIVSTIATVSRTPIPAHMGPDTSSGEAIKQREVGLLAKCQNAIAAFGNCWEQVMKLAVMTQNTYGSGAGVPEGKFTARWKSAQMRSDVDIVKSAVQLSNIISPEAMVLLLAPVFGFDEMQAKLEIERIKERQGMQAMQQLPYSTTNG
jgi:SPP1 family phage portal protein